MGAWRIGCLFRYDKLAGGYGTGVVQPAQKEEREYERRLTKVAALEKMAVWEREPWLQLDHLDGDIFGRVPFLVSNLWSP